MNYILITENKEPNIYVLRKIAANKVVSRGAPEKNPVAHNPTAVSRQGVLETVIPEVRFPSPNPTPLG